MFLTIHSADFDKWLDENYLISDKSNLVTIQGESLTFVSEYVDKKPSEKDANDIYLFSDKNENYYYVSSWFDYDRKFGGYHNLETTDENKDVGIITLQPCTVETVKRAIIED